MKNKSIYIALECIRKKRGLTLSQLADKTGVHVVTYRKFQNEEYNFGFQTFNKVCLGLDVPSFFVIYLATEVEFIKKGRRIEFLMLKEKLDKILNDFFKV